MKCSKCGFEPLIKTDDWYKCPECGAVMFDIESPTMEMERLEKLAADKKKAESEIVEEPEIVE
jgi:DNA-directed RNA polymerase subunit RPC12/RpoP